MVFFHRSGFQHSRRVYATLFWLGDQLVSWDAHDGIKSAVTGLLSGGISGFSLNHSDIGGYTTINNPLAQNHRSKELLLRWMELGALTTIYRTHEGNIPDANVQFYCGCGDPGALQPHGAGYTTPGSRCAKNWSRKLPGTACRSRGRSSCTTQTTCSVYQLSYQEYLLGTDILVAPVLDPASKKPARLPAGRPLGSPVERAHLPLQIFPRLGRNPAPLGQPGVFYRLGSEDGEDFVIALQKEGLLP